MDTATADLEIDIANGKETREFLGQSMGFENELIGQSNFPHQPIIAICHRARPILKHPAGFFQTSASGRNMPSTAASAQGGKQGTSPRG
jgi:hypothetical protein